MEKGPANEALGVVAMGWYYWRMDEIIVALLAAILLVLAGGIMFILQAIGRAAEYIRRGE